LHPRLATLPSLAAEAVEHDTLALAAVASQQLDILDWKVELIPARIFQRDAVVRRIADLDLRQAFVAADAMIGVHDEVAGRERRQFFQEGRGSFALLPPPDEPVAEHVLLGEDRDLGGREAVIKRKDEQARLRFRTQRFLP